jgi:CMP-N-acetylneuraminic acid synthetase
MDKTLGLILARGGSKRVPRKNLRLLGGKPLLNWTIDAALAATSLDRVILSTDDAEIAATATAAGCDVPFMRPPELATDTATSADVVRHALAAIDATATFSRLVLLQPTSPLRLAEDIDGAVAVARGQDLASVVGICPAETVPAHLFWHEADGRLSSVTGAPFEEIAGRRSQDCRPGYRLNGAIYVARLDWFLAGGELLGPDSVGYVMPRDRSVDIDDEMGLTEAEMILSRR